MKKFLLVVMFATGALYSWQHIDEVYAALGLFQRPAQANYLKMPSKEYSLRSFDRRDMTIDDLLVKGSHTLVYVTSENCSQCDQLDEDLRTILNHRKDVAFRKLTVKNQDSDNVDKYQTRFDQHLLEKHGILEPPFVQLYNPAGDIIATDHRESESGEKFIQYWAKKEQRTNS